MHPHDLLGGVGGAFSSRLGCEDRVGRAATEEQGGEDPEDPEQAHPARSALEEPDERRLEGLPGAADRGGCGRRGRGGAACGGRSGGGRRVAAECASQSAARPGGSSLVRWSSLLLVGRPVGWQVLLGACRNRLGGAIGVAPERLLIIVGLLHDIVLGE